MLTRGDTRRIPALFLARWWRSRSIHDWHSAKIINPSRSDQLRTIRADEPMDWVVPKGAATNGVALSSLPAASRDDRI